MSDDSGENQDLKPDQNPAEDDGALLDVDAILAEEDPDFLNQINKIKIDSAGIDLSIMEQALEMKDDGGVTVLSYLGRPFDFKTNTRPVLIFWAVVIGAMLALRFSWDGKKILFQQKLFMNSFSAIGTDLKEFNPNTDMEPFYDNPRFSKNLVSISPLRVNLKPSENSGPNPMLAIEVTAEGLSSDAIVEIKDREAEFKDLLARLTEERSYDDLVVTEGKQMICEQYRDLLNAHLTRGQVRRVLLKSFVIKP